MRSGRLVLFLTLFLCAGSCTPAAREAPPPESLPPAVQAIDSGDAAKLKGLLTAGRDANAAHRGRSLLDRAAAKGQVECVGVLLAAGARVNVRDAAGWTPLHRACCQEEPDPEVINALIAAGTDVNARDQRGRTPLLAAMATGQEVAETISMYGPLLSGQAGVEALLAAKADPNLADAEGRTPLHWACQKGFLKPAGMLIAAGAEVNARDKAGRTPLHLLLRDRASRSLEYFVDFLLKSRGDVNAADAQGGTPLHLACDQGDGRVGRLLVAAGARVNAKDNEGRTPLHFAARGDAEWWNYAETFQLLVESKADLNARANDGRSPLIVAVMRGQMRTVAFLKQAGAKEESWTPLHWAAAEGNAEDVKSQIAAKADVNARDRLGLTPLMIAARIGQQPTVAALLTAKADPSLAAVDKSTAVHAAVRSGDVAVLKSLLETKAKVNMADGNGWSSLHLAAQGNRAEMVELLLAAKADVNARTPDGMTALHVAAETGNGRETIQALLGAQADPLARNKDGRRPVDLVPPPWYESYAGSSGREVLATATALAKDELLDRLLAAAAKETKPPGPARTPQEAVNCWAQAIYRRDKPAMLRCLSGPEDAMAAAAAYFDYCQAGLEFRKAMVAVYGRTAWATLEADPLTRLQCPIVNDGLLRTMNVVVTGDRAVSSTIMLGPFGLDLRFYKERDAWRIDATSTIPEMLHGELLANLLDGWAAAEHDLRRFADYLKSRAGIYGRLASEVGKHSVTAETLYKQLQDRIYALDGIRPAHSE